MRALMLWSLLGCSMVADALWSRVTTAHLERLCVLASEADLEKLAPERQRRAIADKLAEEDIAALKQAWQALMSAPPKVRRQVYRELLDGAGHPDFRCAPLERALQLRASR